jgi:thioredoxin-like negative regulator of GroEL
MKKTTVADLRSFLVGLRQRCLVDRAALFAMLKSGPNNLEARFNLAQALAGSENTKRGLAEFLTIIRSFRDDVARKAMVQIFRSAGVGRSLDPEIPLRAC